jgi:pyruvate formate lyase activating enzyme
MSVDTSLDAIPLEARSPFELRINSGPLVPESVVKAALTTGDVGFLHSFTTGSAVDGPGVRVVAWTAGCQLRCLYCHNPDTWNMMNGTAVSLEKAIGELSKYRHGLTAMSGGFTISGGEPLMQDRFAVRLIAAAKQMGIHTALDTNGYLGDRVSDDELEKIDLVLLDLKAYDPEKHQKLTNKDNGPTLEFARRLAGNKRPIWVRYVLVPGLTDEPEEVKKIASFASALGNVERVDVLPFHQMGRFKWERLNLDYKLNDVSPPSHELAESTCDLFRAVGLKAY